MRLWLLFITILLVLNKAYCDSKEEESNVFFEKNIRPVLSKHCYECHSESSSKLKGGLKLDSKDNLLKGGNSGDVIVPFNPDKSLLIKSIRYTDSDYEMPPKYKLPNNDIKNLELWVKNGAFYPVSKVNTNVFVNPAKEHWSYTTITNPNTPRVKNKWISNDIDKFILEKLLMNGLTPSKEADKATLIRRAYYDLTGLPPTKKEVDDFVKNKSKNAYSDLINKLLDSPRYGEKWGRYWLDTARYSDTSGTINVNEEPRYVYSYTYRDWVINALNKDMPYDQFILNQIAADKLSNSTNLAALGFLTLGKSSGNNNDVIDDRIDVVFKGFMASTMACARCHDHKFDPFSIKDYYALHGIFNSSFSPSNSDKPLLMPIKESDGYQDYLKNKLKIENEINGYIDNKFKSALLDFKTNTAKWIVGSRMLNGASNQYRQDIIRENGLNSRMIRRWEASSRQTVNVKKGQKQERLVHPSFYILSKMSLVPDVNFSEIFNLTIRNERENINPYLYSILSSTKNITNLQRLANVYQYVVLNCETNKSEMLGLKEFKDSIFKNEGPLDINRDNFQRFYANNNITMNYDNELRQQRGKLITHELTHPHTPPRAMALLDKEKPTNSYVFIKGDPNSRGPLVSRRFPEFFNEFNKGSYTNGSGRYSLALDIIDTNNPLTARVIVNRIWQGHFEEGFVRTPDDFGIQTEEPVHLDLMNYLSKYLMNNNWSLKSLHKLIMNSSTYKQVSLNDPKKSSIDPYNQYYWRMNILRLDFEELRDTYLWFSGQLDLKMGGPSEELFKAKDTNSPLYSLKRSVYGKIDRNRLPEVLTTFDFATPEMTTGKRFKTTVPKQALFLMNNSFSINQCKSILNRSEILESTNSNDRIIKLYNLIFQRNPTPIELSIGKNYVEDNSSQDIWIKYIHVLLLSNELMFIH